MKHLTSIFIVLFVMNFGNELRAQSEGASLFIQTNFDLTFSENAGHISGSVAHTLQFKKRTSKLLTIADFTLRPKTVFLCCTKSGYGFYFKF